MGTIAIFLTNQHLNMNKLFLSFLFCFLFSSSFCQQDSGLMIQYLKLEDTVMLRHLNTFIDYKNETDSAFKSGTGYVVIFVSRYQQKHNQIGNYNIIDTVYKFSIDIDDVILYRKSSDFAYPLYYSFVKNKLIMFHVDNIPNIITRVHFTEASKASFRKILTPFLRSSEQNDVEKDYNELNLNRIFKRRHKILVIYHLNKFYLDSSHLF